MYAHEPDCNTLHDGPAPCPPPHVHEGEIYGKGEVERRWAATPVLREPEPRTWTTHYVDLPHGGRIEGMDRADALRLAAELGTRAYEACAQLLPNNVVMVDVPRRISGPIL
jgi:hypothetical protein